MIKDGNVIVKAYKI